MIHTRRERGLLMSLAVPCRSRVHCEDSWCCFGVVPNFAWPAAVCIVCPSAGGLECKISLSHVDGGGAFCVIWHKNVLVR